MLMPWMCPRASMPAAKHDRCSMDDPYLRCVAPDGLLLLLLLPLLPLPPPLLLVVLMPVLVPSVLTLALPPGLHDLQLRRLA